MKRLLLVPLLLIYAIAALGQLSKSPDEKLKKQLDYDTLFIKSYHDNIVARMFFSQKFTNLDLYDARSDTELLYKSNNALNLGVGVTVKSFSLNLSYGFKFLNTDSTRHKTRSLDLQTSIYARKFVIDLFGQFYTGLHLENTADVFPDHPEDFYQRPDIKERILGVNGQYIFNNKKFSYRAPFVSNERQMKSAGTFLAGFEGYYGQLEGDSSIVPRIILARGIEQSEGVDKIDFYQFGPNGGYAYSLVMWQRFFATLSLTISLTYGQSKAFFEERGTVVKEDANFGAQARFAIGYNDDNWFTGFSIVNNVISNTNNNEDVTANVGIGVYKFTFAWRFNQGPKVQKLTRLIP